MKPITLYSICFILAAVAIYAFFYVFFPHLPNNLEEPLNATITVGFMWGFGSLMGGMRIFPKLNLGMKLLAILVVILLSMAEITALYPLVALQSELVTSLVGLACTLVTFYLAQSLINHYKK